MEKKETVILRRCIETLLFIIWPFAAFVSAFFHLRDRYSNIFIPLFFALVGYSRKLGVTSDAYHWMQVMLDYKWYGISDFLGYLFDTTTLNFYSFTYHIYLYISAILFEHTASFWAATFFLYSFVMLLIYRLITKRTNCLDSRKTAILGLLFFLFFPFSSFGVRFWVAAIVFIYGFYQKMLYDRKLGLFLIVLSATFHYTFIFLVGVYFFAYYNKRMSKSHFIVFALFVIFMGFGLYMSGFFDFMNVFDQKIEGYTNTENRGEYFSSKSFFILFDRFACPICSLLLLLYLNKKTSGISDVQLINIRHFLIFSALSLLLFLGTYDALDRFSRVFSFSVLTFWVYLTNKGIKTNLFVTLCAGMAYFYHIMVNFVITRSWVDYDVLFSSVFSILSKPDDVILLY